MPAQDHRLTTAEVARFVADGFLRFDALVPDDVNQRVIEELDALFKIKINHAIGAPAPEGMHFPESLTPLSDCYPAPSAIGDYLRLPQIQGIIQSLVGADPVFDHDFVHLLPAGSTYTQHLHVDAVIDNPSPAFDIQLFYYPTEVKPGCGGTRMVPGSHLRRSRAEGVARYQNILGEQQYSGPAGTVMVFHQGMWHAGQANPGNDDRWLYKIRLNPTQPQVRLWNMDDFDGLHNDARDHTFAHRRNDSVAEILRQMQPWQQGHETRYELMQRTRLWRYLSDDPSFDADYYYTRMETRERANGSAA